MRLFQILEVFMDIIWGFDQKLGAEGGTWIFLRLKFAQISDTFRLILA